MRLTRTFHHVCLMSLFACGLAAAAHPEKTPSPCDEYKAPAVDALPLKSQWLKEANGETLLDPQTSGLTPWRNNRLMSISDASAHGSQVLNLLEIEPQSQTVVTKYPIVLAPQIKQSCFGEYLAYRPDLEALVVDPDDDRVFYSVTEDAKGFRLNAACQARYQQSGSTVFPSVLLRLQLAPDGSHFVLTHLKPLQFSADMAVGNFPNDGIEGLAFGKQRQLYLGLEKDSQSHARIFSVTLDAAFWQNQDFVAVVEESLRLPRYTDELPHPVNGLTFMTLGDDDWLVAVARNDNELWLIDPEGRKKTIQVPVKFLASRLADATVASSEPECVDYEEMDNYSMEGVTLQGEQLWIVNDPWKARYRQNIRCKDNRLGYERMSPLLTRISLQDLHAVIASN